LSEVYCFFFSSRRRHTRLQGDWSSDVCSSDLVASEIISLGSPDSRVLPRASYHSRTSSTRRSRLVPRWRSTSSRARATSGTMARSEERRVGKEWRDRGWREREKKKT